MKLILYETIGQDQHGEVEEALGRAHGVDTWITRLLAAQEGRTLSDNIKGNA